MIRLAAPPLRPPAAPSPPRPPAVGWTRAARGLHRCGALLALALALLPAPAAHAGRGTALPFHAAPGATFVLTSPLEIPDGASCQWSFNGVPIPGATAATLSLSAVSAADTGTYSLRVRVPGFADRVSYEALTVDAPPPTPLERAVTGDRLFVSDSSGYWGNFGLAGVLDDGRFVVSARWTQAISYHHWTTYFYFNPDGSLSETRRGGGYAEPEPFTLLRNGRLVFAERDPFFASILPNPYDVIRAVALQPDGRYLITYSTYEFTRYRMVTVRLNADLTVDPGFQLAEPAGSPSRFYFDARGRCLVRATDESRDRLVRILADGSLDPSFAAVDLFQLWPDHAGPYLPPISVVPQDDGTILAYAGLASPEERVSRWTFRRINEDGSLAPGAPASLVLPEPSVSPGLADGQGRVYWLVAGALWRYSAATGALDPSFYGGVDPATGSGWTSVARLDDGHVVGLSGLPDPGNSMRLRFAVLRTTDAAPALAPGTLLTSDRPPFRLMAGDPVELRAHVFGTGPFAYEWFSPDGAELPADIHGPTLRFEACTAHNLGRYQCRVTGPAGSAVSGEVALEPASTARLAALSGRGIVAPGEDTLIAGWSTAAYGHLLFRAVGPTLAGYGVAGAAADPALALFDVAGASLAANDDWSSDLAAGFAHAGAAPLPTGSKDAAAERVTIGPHTMHVTNRGNERGVALAEIYDDWRSARLTALSLRGYAGRDSETLIGGFVVADDQGFGRPVRVLLRAVGPTLGSRGIARPLPRARLTLFDARGAALATNRGWSGSPEAAAIATGAAALGLAALPAGSADAALLVDLPPGVYTAHINGDDDGTGVALLEIYRVR